MGNNTVQENIQIASFILWQGEQLKKKEKKSGTESPNMSLNNYIVNPTSRKGTNNETNEKTTTTRNTPTNYDVIYLQGKRL